MQKWGDEQHLGENEWLIAIELATKHQEEKLFLRGKLNHFRQVMWFSVTLYYYLILTSTTFRIVQQSQQNL